MQSGAAHDPVHQEGGPGHVAGILKQQDEYEEEQDLGQEDQDGANAGDQSVDDKTLYPSGWKSGGRRRAKGREPRFGEVLQRGRPSEHRLEHEEQQAEQDQ